MVERYGEIYWVNFNMNLTSSASVHVHVTLRFSKHTHFFFKIRNLLELFSRHYLSERASEQQYSNVEVERYWNLDSQLLPLVRIVWDEHPNYMYRKCNN